MIKYANNNEMDLEQERHVVRERLCDTSFIPITRGELSSAMIGTAVIASAVGFGFGAASCSRGPRKLVKI